MKKLHNTIFEIRQFENTIISAPSDLNETFFNLTGWNFKKDQDYKEYLDYNMPKLGFTFGKIEMYLNDSLFARGEISNDLSRLSIEFFYVKLNKC